MLEIPYSIFSFCALTFSISFLFSSSFANAEVTLALASMSAGVVAWRGFINTNEEENRKDMEKVRAQKEKIEYGISNKEALKIYSICNQYTKIEEKEGSDDQ